MTDTPLSSDPPQYAVARLQDALAHDPRVAALDITVRVVADQIFVTGAVATDERQQAIAELVNRLLPTHTLHNHVVVVDAAAPTGAEDVT